MAYETTPIIESTPAVNKGGPAVMREEMVVDPYKQRVMAKKAPAAVETAPPSQKPNVSDAVRPAAEPAATAESVTLTPQMAALARKEQRFRQSEQQLKARETALEERAAKYAKLEEMQAKLAAKDYSGLDGVVNYDEYTNWLIDRANAQSPEAKALQEMKAQVEGIDKTQKEFVEKQYTAAIEQRRTAVNALVESNPDFGIIKRAGRTEAVVQHIVDTYNEDSKELSVEQAAKEVKEILIEQAKRAAGFLEEEPKAKPVAGEKKPLPPLKTITNNMTAIGEPVVTKSRKPMHEMSESERYAEAHRRVQERQALQQSR
jgi:hypothetical protein